MTIPNLPTDNLYKFLFIAGLAIMLTSSIFYFDQLKSWEEKRDILHFDREKTLLESEFLNDDYKDFSKKMENKNITSNLVKKTKSDSLSIQTYVNRMKEEIESNGKLRQELSYFIKISRKRIMNEKMLLIKSELLARDNKLLWELNIITKAAFIFGFILSVFGYNKWLNLVQIPTDEKLRLELEQLKRIKNEQQ